MNKTWTVTCEEENGDIILPFPAELMTEMGWREGDVLDFDMTDDGVLVKNLTWEARQAHDAGNVA